VEESGAGYPKALLPIKEIFGLIGNKENFDVSS
jgi:hypothetical protein